MQEKKKKKKILASVTKSNLEFLIKKELSFNFNFYLSYSKVRSVN